MCDAYRTLATAVFARDKVTVFCGEKNQPSPRPIVFPRGTKDATDVERAYETKDCKKLIEVILRHRPDEAEGIVTLLGNVLTLLSCPEVEILDHCAIPGYEYVTLGIDLKKHPHKGSENEAGN